MTDLIANTINRARERTLTVVELVGFAEQLNNSGAHDQAVELYKIWLDHNNDDPIAYAVHFNYGVVLTGLARFPEAKEAFDASLRINPDFFPSYINLGNVFEQLADLSAAEACWQQVVNRLSTISDRLESGGQRMAHLKIAGPDDLDPALIKRLVAAAVKLNADKGDPTKRG